MLCKHCNTGLGSFKDDPDALERAAVYLKTHATGLAIPEKKRKKKP